MMRMGLALITCLACATSAAAQTAPDRYGPVRTPARAPAQAPMLTASAADTLTYGSRMLSWASKVEPAPAAAPAPVSAPLAAPAPQRPAATDPRAYTLGEIEPAPRPAPARQAPVPASLYDSPAPAPAAPVQAARPEPASAAPVAAAQVQPAQPAAAPVRVAAASPMAGAGGGVPVRFYSVAREYGLTPDPLPPTPKGDHYVLIGPSDEATAPDSDSNSAKDADQRADATDRLF
ncbi:hypothetical protein [Phenylobacterium sp.]|uniref:hypothetical protein n=1 Tax=Phenylobacterium sp. TaxID=1871053 RepID=UPI0035B315F9